MQTIPSPELAVAIAAARAGGATVLRYFREGVQMRVKESYNLVSDADVDAEEAVVTAIKEHFPSHAFFGEETHKDELSSEDVWIIDPLDGTNNFAHGISQFSVSIAYAKDGEVKAGVVYNPVHDELYCAERGKGAFCNGKRAAVSKESSLNQALIGTGFYYDRGLMMERTLDSMRDLFHTDIHGIRRIGAASLDLCHVGMGHFGAYFEYKLAAWDFAAGALFVEEAGGRVTTARGDSLPLDTSSVLASNGALHQSVLAIVGKHHP
ncbi:MAG: inositol monophosphatase [Bdellovibrionales bacterium]|nr:inositol monophosphatase [Bdellovibrionales bacterium]